MTPAASNELPAPTPPLPAALPRPPVKKRSIIAWFFIFGYVFVSTLICVGLIAHAPAMGGPIARALPANHLAYVHLKSATDLWNAAQEHPGLKALWDDPEFQRLTHFSEKWTERQAKQPPGLKWLGLYELNPESWGFLTDNEIALAVLPPDETQPAPDPNIKPERPALLFLRLNGGKGALLRLILNRVTPKKTDAHFFDLGGGLVALGFHGAKPAKGQPPAKDERLPIENDTALEVFFQPGTLAPDKQPNWTEMLYAPPGLGEMLGFEKAPKSVHLLFSSNGKDGLNLKGRWNGPLPANKTPAPLLDPGIAENSKPLLDVKTPFNPRATYQRWTDSMLKHDKERAKWLEKMGRLKEAGVDLDRDFWPATDVPLRVTVLTSENAALDQAVVTASVGMKTTEPARKALKEMSRVLWKGLYENKADKDADRPYVLKRTNGSKDQFALVKGKFTRPYWLLDDTHFAMVSDGGVPAVSPTGVEPLAPDVFGKEMADPASIFALTVDGVRFTPSMVTLVQMDLDDKRDEMGTAAFMAKYPDQNATLALVEKYCKLVGTFSVQLTQHDLKKPELGEISAHWEPKLSPQPAAK